VIGVNKADNDESVHIVPPSQTDRRLSQLPVVSAVVLSFLGPRQLNICLVSCMVVAFFVSYF